MVTVGETAPTFTLEGYADGEVRSVSLDEQIADNPALLVFYVYDFSPVCTDQMCEVNDAEFLSFGKELSALGISTDGPYSHREFATKYDITYPLISDPNKRIYEAYGMLEATADEERAPQRGLVVVDSDLTVLHKWVAEDNWDDWTIDRLEDAIDVVRDAAQK